MPCLHGKSPSLCRTTQCKGSYYCWIENHQNLGRRKEYCKGCKGSALCWDETHQNLGQRKHRCKGCKGSALCWDESHNYWGKPKAYCKGCEGTGLCWVKSHKYWGKDKAYCKECKGVGLCWIESHNHLGKAASYCKGCKGKNLCWIESHNHLGKVKANCKGCKGKKLCEKHLKLACRECSPIKHLILLVSSRTRNALKTKAKRSLEYLGCSGEYYRSYLEKNFKEGMTWENHGAGHGKWNIDHIIPLMYIDENGNPPSQEEIGRRLHYKNTQPLWYEDNVKKGNRFIG